MKRTIASRICAIFAAVSAAAATVPAVPTQAENFLFIKTGRNRQAREEAASTECEKAGIRQEAIRKEEKVSGRSA